MQTFLVIGVTQGKLRYDLIKSTLSDADDSRASLIFAGNVCSNHVATGKILKNGWNRERSVAPRTPEQRLGIEFVSRNGRGTKKTAVLLVGRVAKLQAVGSYRSFPSVSPKRSSGRHHKVRPEFHLRMFARCCECNYYVTGGFSRGRSKYYPYYRCSEPVRELRFFKAVNPI